MASHFSWYPSSDSVTIPWNARYAFPTQANKTMKMTSRIPPKNGSQFQPGQVIRLEFPAQGYVNPTHTTIEFDVTMSYIATTSANYEYAIRFQNNIQSIFSRVRIMYGSTPLEDIINYNVIVRNLTEWTAGNPHCSYDQSTICEGVGGVTVASDGAGTPGLVNVRQKFVQGYNYGSSATNTAPFVTGTDWRGVPHTQSAITAVTGTTRRYQIQLATGLFTSEKLIPTKFMASQLAIEITLETAANCLYLSHPGSSITPLESTFTYYVSEVNLIPEVLEFDASYDDMFLKGLQNGGVPIKFSSWHTFLFSSAQSTSVNLQVQERSRSVKSIFTVQRRSQPSITKDNGACFFDTSSDGTTLQTFQTRIGSRYFPASPVQCANQIGGSSSNGGCEAFIELQKALNTIGDYRLSTPVNTSRWALQNSAGELQDFDFDKSLSKVSATGVSTFSVASSSANAFSGDLGSQCFAMACSLETSNGVEISGLNAEEQSDISVIAYWKSPQQTGDSSVASSLEVYTFYDAMIVLRENNVLELIQ